MTEKGDEEKERKRERFYGSPASRKTDRLPLRLPGLHLLPRMLKARFQREGMERREPAATFVLSIRGHGESPISRHA